MVLQWNIFAGWRLAAQIGKSRADLGFPTNNDTEIETSKVHDDSLFSEQET